LVVELPAIFGDSRAFEESIWNDEITNVSNIVDRAKLVYRCLGKVRGFEANQPGNGVRNSR